MFPPPLLTGCDDYDDSELWQNVNDLKSRIEALETKIGQMNTEIAALQKIVDDAVTVVKVEKSADGYVIYFSDNTTAEIKNGTAGADAPVIGVKQDTDEVYYWTITTDGKTEWLMAGGVKLRVTGESVKPVMSVDDEGYWTISYDGGKTSERILDAAGDPVSAVTEGQLRRQQCLFRTERRFDRDGARAQQFLHADPQGARSRDFRFRRDQGLGRRVRRGDENPCFEARRVEGDLCRRQADGHGPDRSA